MAIVYTATGVWALSNCLVGVRAMRCMACGGEMILMNVVQDDTMAVPGFEHHTFTCSDCEDTERRLVFTKPSRESDTEPSPVQAAQPVMPASTVQDEHVAPSVFMQHSREGDTEPTPVQAAPPIAPASTVQDEHVAPSVFTQHSHEGDTEAAPAIASASTVQDEQRRSGVLSRVVAKMRGH